MILFFSFIILIISWTLFKKAGASLDINKINLVSYLFYTFVVWIFIGSILAYYDLSAFDPEKFGSKSNKLNAWLSIMYMMIATPISMIFVNIASGCNRSQILAYNQKSFESATLDDKVIKFALYGVAIFSSAYFLIDTIPRINSIPLYNKIINADLFSSTEFYEQRNTTRLTSNNSSIMTLLLSSIPIATYFSFSSIIKKNEGSDKLFFTYFLIISLFMQLFDLSKGRVLFFLMGLFFVYLISGKTIRSSTVIIFLAFTILYVGFSYWFFMGTILENVNILSLLELAVSAISGRVFVGQISGFYECLMQFPTNYPHIGFASTGKFLHQLFGLDYSPDYGILLINLMKSTPGMITFGSGHYTTFFLGEAWANFGIIGIIIAPFLVGLNIQIIQIAFINLKKTPLSISFFISIILILPVRSGFREFYYPMWLIQILSILFLILFISLLIRGAARTAIKKG